MKVSEAGELGVVELVAKMVAASRDDTAESWRRLLIGIGDDAAAWHGDETIQLATCDSLIENVHFTAGMATWEELGWKALAVNLSDIAAMGGLPRYALVSLAVPADTEVEAVAGLYRGMLELAGQSGLAIIGGDTNCATLTVIDVTVLGTMGRAKQPLRRSAARPGDQIAVTGHLGGAAGGLEMLRRGLKFDGNASAALRQAFLKPNPRLAEGRLLVEGGVAAAIDISDGLLRDLGHVCRASQVSARVEVEQVPVGPGLKSAFGDRALGMALSGGEDYELLFTASTEAMERVRAKSASPVTVIGEITAGEAGTVVVVDGKGKVVPVDRAGWEHFTTP